MEKLDANALAKRLHTLCEQATIDPIKMAKAINMPEAIFHDYLYGKKLPNEIELHRLAKCFGVKCSALRGEISLPTEKQSGHFAEIPVFSVEEFTALAREGKSVPKDERRRVTSFRGVSYGSFSISGNLPMAASGALSEQSGLFFIEPNIHVFDQCPWLCFNHDEDRLLIYFIQIHQGAYRLQTEHQQLGIVYNNKRHNLIGGLSHIEFRY